MKRISQYLVLTVVSGLLCLFLAIPANAQRGGGHGGGGGGGHFGGGGGGGSHFSGGGGRPSGGFSGGNRSSFQQHSTAGSHYAVQGRSAGMQGNTRSFNNRVGVNGARSYNSRVGVSGRVGVNGSYRGASRGYVGGRSYAGRGGYAGGRSYYRGGRGGYYGRGPWGYHGGFYYNRGFYGSLYYPRLGFSLGFLPFGYYPFYWGDSQFYYSDGYYYQQNDNQYTVVEPPVGAAINTLPSKAQPISINGQQYYELNGVYYLPVTKDDGTVVYQIAGKDGQLDTGSADNGNPNDGGNGGGVAPPHIGDVVSDLPPDTRTIKINGQKYIVSPDDYYFQETTDTGGKRAYKVVGTPDDAPGN